MYSHSWYMGIGSSASLDSGCNNGCAVSVFSPIHKRREASCNHSGSTPDWTCDLTVFLSQEQIECSVLDEQLRPGVNRYAPYVSAVAHDPQAAYVFPIGSSPARIFATRLLQQGAISHYRIISVDHYVIYQPLKPDL